MTSGGNSLQWRHNGHDNVSNHQPYDCLLNRLFRRRWKKTSKPRVTGLCVGNSPETGEFPAQMASNAENVSFDDVIMWHSGARGESCITHYCDVIMCAISSYITSLTIVYSIVYSGEWQKTSKLRVTGLYEGNSPVAGEFPAQRVSNAENACIWWRHHVEKGRSVIRGTAISISTIIAVYTHTSHPKRVASSLFKVTSSPLIYSSALRQPRSPLSAVKNCISGMGSEKYHTFLEILTFKNITDLCNISNYKSCIHIPICIPVCINEKNGNMNKITWFVT